MLRLFTTVVGYPCVHSKISNLEIKNNVKLSQPVSSLNMEVQKNSLVFKE